MKSPFWIMACALCTLTVFTACGADEDTPAETLDLPEECSSMVAPAQEGPEATMLEGDGSLFISVEEVHDAYQAGQSFYFLDARPPSDFKLHHIEGAFSMPFYDVEACYPALPKDAWIVTYCACPHNESEHAANVLIDQGYTKVRVLDEGYIIWRDRNYPTSDKP